MELIRRAPQDGKKQWEEAQTNVMIGSRKYRQWDGRVTPDLVREILQQLDVAATEAKAAAETKAAAAEAASRLEAAPAPGDLKEMFAIPPPTPPAGVPAPRWPPAAAAARRAAAAEREGRQVSHV